MLHSLLDANLIPWIKDNLKENHLLQKVEEIISADVPFSEKSYRFLKLCGAHTIKELIDLFKQIRLKEFESEKELKISDVKNDIQKQINERKTKVRNENFYKQLKRGILIGSISGSILGLIYGIITGGLGELLKKNL